MDIIKWILIAIAAPIIGWLVVRTKRNAKALSERIEEYHREQEELERQGKKGPINPYEQMAEIYAPKEEDKKDK